MTMKCPRCKSKEVIPFQYGLPGETMLKEAREGKIRLGGCVIFELSDDWHCKKCKFEWYDISKKRFNSDDSTGNDYSKGEGELYEQDMANREKWRKALYDGVDADGPSYPVMAIMNNGCLKICGDVNDVFDAERDGVKWMFR